MKITHRDSLMKEVVPLLTWYFNFGVFDRYGEHYEWNKVVTCIHNVLSQQRYLEHYGEVTIKNLKSNICTCKITFVKVNKSYSAMFFGHLGWSNCFFKIKTTNNGHIFSLSCSLVIGVQRQTRMRCKEWCLTKVAMSFTGLEDFGMKESSVTLCQLQNVFGSQVSHFLSLNSMTVQLTVWSLGVTCH